MELNNQDYEIAISIVEALVEYGLCDHLTDCGHESLHEWFWENDLGALGFWGSSGISKACISHDDLPGWVIKVGFTKGLRHDYAELEYKNYCAAVDRDLECYFPETLYLGTFGGRKFFLQSWAECDEDGVTSKWYDKVSAQVEEAGEEFDNDSIWEYIYDMDDTERADAIFNSSRLSDFLLEYGIGDLHEGNFGKIGGCWVIIDFSGWAG